MIKNIAIVLTASIMLDVAAGHSCSDGSRVKCLAIKSSNGAPSTYGQGYGAGGYPTCSADGQKLFCLYDHDYHRCADGSEPCCVDGSNPSHNGDHHGHDHDLDCSVESAPTQVASNAVTAEASMAVMAGASMEPIVLDNMDSASVKEMKNAFEGSYQPCMVDAYKGQFHHDWARNKGSAHLTYKFMPPADGCYSIEEYHPGSDKMCSRYLPTNARLDIDYCKGKSVSLEINQAQNAAQWNEIVPGLMFYAGIEGKLTMKNHMEEVCEEAGNCFWVADAFRLTYKGPSCQGGQMKPLQKAAMSQTEASLYIRLSLGSGLEKDAVMLKMQEHKPQFEKTFAVHLGYKSVSILEMTASGRRLLDDESSQVSVQVRFNAQGKNREASTPETFKTALQADFSTIVPGVTVEEVSKVEWQSQNAEEDDDQSYILYFAIASGSLAFLGVASFCVWKLLQARKTPETLQVEQVVVKPCEETWKDEATKDLEKADKVDHCDTASTGTPASESPASLDGTDSETNSKKDEETPTLCAVPTA